MLKIVLYLVGFVGTIIGVSANIAAILSNAIILGREHQVANNLELAIAYANLAPVIQLLMVSYGCYGYFKWVATFK